MKTRITSKFPVLATGLAALVALPTPAAATEPKDFGCSVRQNLEAQVVDMDPQYAGDLVEGGVGQRSSAAVKRYMTDNIRPLIRSDLRSAVGLQGGASKSGDVSGSGPK
jgi:hypothetical protein